MTEEESLTEKIVIRKSLGKDLGQSIQKVIYKDGKPIARLHQVFDITGKIIHQHLESIGKYGTTRIFPSEWTGIPRIE